MAEDKTTNNIENETPDSNVNELIRIVHSHLTPIASIYSPINSTSSATRTYTPPLMGTSARAAKRRVDSDSGPIRIEGTDTYNQQLQHHYQNVRQILEDQQQNQDELHSSNVDMPPESRQSFSAKRDFFEQRFKTPPPTYDSPPRQQQAQKIVTTITTTTTTAAATPTGPTYNVQDRTSSSSNESPSVDRVLEQAVELQKMSNINAIKNESQAPLIIERTEEYQVFLDSSNHEVRRTPSTSRTSIVQLTKTGHATDLDQAQAQVESLTDDHQAIQHLTRVLQEHNVSTINEYKRSPSQTNQNPIALSLLSSPNILVDRPNLPITSDYTVIDALVNNPLGTMNDNYNNMLNKRCNEIMTNLRNPEYLNTLKQTTTTTTTTAAIAKDSKKKSKEKKPKEKKLKEQNSRENEKESKRKTSLTDDNIERATVRSHITTAEVLQAKTVEPMTAATLSEQVPLIDPKEKKKQDKEKKKALKVKSKSKSKSENYQAIDAIISSPISIRLPDSYLTKYNVSPPLSLSLPLQSIPSTEISNPIINKNTTTTATLSKDNTNTNVQDKNQTLFHLIQIVGAIQLHGAPGIKDSLHRVPTKTSIATDSKESIIAPKQSAFVLNEVIHEQALLEQQRPIVTSNPTVPSLHGVVRRQSLLEQQRPITSPNEAETNLQSEPIKPRIIYRYMDEQGRILKISSVPPSELREQPAQQYTYHNIEPPYLYGRHIAVNDDRRHPLPQYEQHATWHGEPKLPTTVTREDFELRDRRVPQLSEQFIPAERTIPASVEHERPSRTSSQQQPRTYHYPNQQAVKLAWLPLSYPAEQAMPGGATGYDTDSTISERSTTQRPYEYGPTDSQYRYTNRPYYNDHYYNRSPGPSYYRNPPTVHYGGRGVSPEYGGLSRNYIEVFRGGDFRESKPSEIYSLPLSEQMRTSPNFPSSSRYSRYDQYQSERYGTMLNRNNIASTQPAYYSNSLPKSHYQNHIPPSTVHASTYYTHRSPFQHRTVQSSPNPECKNFIRHSKSFDYRPLRTKLQREYKITSNLLVDEWDYPQTSQNNKYSAATSATNQSGVSSPDDVFISNRTNKA
ncbi:unnamed protein product [Rotaria socialis]|uniref:Uncharacterized protein n=5 Tax=Rotaria socialis TaxID=392032 RepID=A0A820TH85_9BILA|nr:unnamed protein product [Rotaria socialis]CAF3203449.1 unnamed protein product [Rotaria socialis]CAF3591536.1 unnamed protein product [Rotaria socialis]CAF4118807.1 unnamed protein product [Rotaria socialis]CAF4470250.1 unnamed protein product [Rotaria socialis]